MRKAVRRSSNRVARKCEKRTTASHYHLQCSRKELRSCTPEFHPDQASWVHQKMTIPSPQLAMGDEQCATPLTSRTFHIQSHVTLYHNNTRTISPLTCLQDAPVSPWISTLAHNTQKPTQNGGIRASPHPPPLPLCLSRPSPSPASRSSTSSSTDANQRPLM